jgi:hypothetical protein
MAYESIRSPIDNVLRSFDPEGSRIGPSERAHRPRTKAEPGHFDAGTDRPRGPWELRPPPHPHKGRRDRGGHICGDDQPRGAAIIT